MLIDIVNRNDDGPGSLRDAFRIAEKESDSIIISSVDGDIWLDSPIWIRGARGVRFLSRYGGTPTVRGASLKFRDCSGLQIEDLRVRPGVNLGLAEPFNQDTFTFVGCRDVRLKKCVGQWSTDEIVNVIDSVGVRFDRCLFAEALDVIHPGNTAGHSNGPLVNRSSGVVFKGCVLAHCGHRTPKIVASDAEWIESVVYNPMHLYAELTDMGGTGRFCRLAVRDSYFIPGKDTVGFGGNPYAVHVNRIEGAAEVMLSRCDVVGFRGVYADDTAPNVRYMGGYEERPHVSLEDILSACGTGNPDEHEDRIINDVRQRTGRIIKEVPRGLGAAVTV